jgi:uncharacterized protein YndB with AHSA1/START domain
MNKLPYQIEFVFNECSIPSLWSCIGNHGGLSKWFANECKLIDEKTIRFIWDKQSQDAIIKSLKPNELIRFHWLDDENEKSYFELKIYQDELTGVISLIITDFCLYEDLESEKMLWSVHMEKLKRNLGI